MKKQTTPRPAARGTRWTSRASLVTLACMAVGVAGALPATASSGDATESDPEVVVADGAAIGDSAWGDVSAAEVADSLVGGVYRATRDEGSLTSVVSSVGLTSVLTRRMTGKGVTVAVVDTGIAPVEGLDAAGKVVNGPDLSFEGQRAGTRYVDGFGHGTHMAGIIAGKDAGANGFAGVAPDAQLLNMKVGAADGAADVTQVIAALDWVVAHRKDNGMNVRVINLAYGTQSVQPWQVDPLARAVENAWNAGIVVVAAAGNDGLEAPSLLMPAVDPHVLAVGAVDHVGTESTLDDVVADFSNGGSTTRRADVIAPGRSIVSLRVPGSYIDTFHPEGRVTGDATGRFFRGSGTSQATAVTAGEVALLLQARPSLTPDQVKALLKATARPLVHSRPEMGAGVTDVARAITTPLLGLRIGTDLPASTGTGSLDASRGGEHVIDPSNGAVLAGEVDALGSPWDGKSWSAASAKQKSWKKGEFNGRTWTGNGWDGDDHRAAAWDGDSWSGLAWSTHDWSDSVWEGRSWRNTGWEGRSWRADSWLGRSWRAGGWVGRSWRSVS
ncbi:S8 family serine peptidase [Solicola sp. PLA-1-18]|uniref:S8 family serine peptidase n=1 Tax=Solicola sp. PLA-1-18 TaxID=3380532 RepID=UPI003B80563B